MLFLAAFDDNDAIMSQLHALTMLCESFIKSLTIYIPYFPVVRLPYLRALPAWRVNDALAARLPDLPQQASGAYSMHCTHTSDSCRLPGRPRWSV